MGECRRAQAAAVPSTGDMAATGAGLITTA